MIAVLDAVHGDGSGEPIDMRTQLIGRPEWIPGPLDKEHRYADLREVRDPQLVSFAGRIVTSGRSGPDEEPHPRRTIGWGLHHSRYCWKFTVVCSAPHGVVKPVLNWSPVYWAVQK